MTIEEKANEYAKKHAYTSYFGDSWTDKQQADAELKYDVSFSALKQCYIAGAEEVTKQLDEAKEIIRELLKTQPPIENVYDIGKFDIDDYGDAIAKAEALLECPFTKEEIDVIEDLCARLRYICKEYKDVDLTKCIIVGGDLPFTHISNVPYLPCLTISEYHLANCDNYKACRDFEDGFKEIKE